MRRTKGLMRVLRGITKTIFTSDGVLTRVSIIHDVSHKSCLAIMDHESTHVKEGEG